MSSWANPAYLPIGRLRSGISINQASLGVSALARSLQAHRQGALVADAGVVELRHAEYGHTRTPLLTLAASAGALLALACLNIGALLSAIGRTRVHEYATRIAVGASRRHLLFQVFVEHSALLLIGGVLAIPVTVVSHRLLYGMVPRALMRVPDHGPLITSMGVAAATASLVTLGVGLASAWRLSACNPWSPSAATAVRSFFVHWRHVALLAQVSVTVGLLFTVALVLQALYTLSRIPLGFNAGKIVGIELMLGQKYWSGGEEYAALLRSIEVEASQRPSIGTAALVSDLPTTEEGLTRVRISQEQDVSVLRRSISPNYTGLLRIPYQRGTNVDWRNKSDGGVLINDSLRRLSNDTLTIGSRVRASASITYTVIGIVNDTREWAVVEPPKPMIYDVFVSRPMRFWLIADSSEGTTRVADELRAAVNSVDSSIPIAQTISLEQWISRGRITARFLARVSGVLALLALLLVAIGISGGVRAIISARSREQSIRAALGATPIQLSWTLARPLILTLVGGTALGIWLGTAMGNILRTLLHGVGSVDSIGWFLVALVVVACLLGVVWPVYKLVTASPSDHLRDMT